MVMIILFSLPKISSIYETDGHKMRGAYHTQNARSIPYYRYPYLELTKKSLHSGKVIKNTCPYLYAREQGKMHLHWIKTLFNIFSALLYDMFVVCLSVSRCFCYFAAHALHVVASLHQAFRDTFEPSSKPAALPTSEKAATGEEAKVYSICVA